LERLERHSFKNRGALIRDHESDELTKRNKKILTGTSVPLDTCLLMGDPVRNFGLDPATPENMSWNLPEAKSAFAWHRCPQRTWVRKKIAERPLEPLRAVFLNAVNDINKTDDRAESPLLLGRRLANASWKLPLTPWLC
jgi:hypothetical protein